MGAGITGLTAAFHLGRMGFSTVVLEASDRPGGLAASFTMDGVVFDLGPHILFINGNRRAGAFLKSLLSGVKVRRSRYRFAVCDGRRTWRLPVTPAELLRYPVWAKSSVMGRVFKGSAPMPPTVDSHLRKSAGDRLYESVFEPLLRKKLGVSGAELHEDWWLRPPKPVKAAGGGNRREAGASLRETVCRALHGMMPYFRYPEGGMGTVTRELLRGIPGPVITDCGRVTVNHSRDSLTKVSIPGRTIPAAAVIWTAPVGDFYQGLGEPCPAPAPCSATLMVFLTLKGEAARERRYVYTYHPADGPLFNRAYQPCSVNGGDSPRGVTGICFEVRATEASRDLPLGKLVDRIVADAGKEGLFTGKPLSARTVEVPHASPLPTVDNPLREGMRFMAANRFHNLVFAGRQGNFCNCMMPDAVEQGIQAAEIVAGTCRPGRHQ